MSDVRAILLVLPGTRSSRVAQEILVEKGLRFDVVNAEEANWLGHEGFSSFPVLFMGSTRYEGLEEIEKGLSAASAKA